MATPPQNSPLPASQLVDAALGIGFKHVAVVNAQPSKEATEALKKWLAKGYHGSLEYMAKDPARGDPTKVLPGAQSAVVVAVPHRSEGKAKRQSPDSEHGQIARYARGPDYHYVIKEKLWLLGEALQSRFGPDLGHRAVVDSAPLLERDMAVRGGLAFFGKNSMAIVPGQGSYVLLGALLLDHPIDEEISTHQGTKATLKGCGDCTLCLDACPTQAIVADGVVDARRCISYWTIETRADIPKSIKAALGDRVFGCDICQEVCPYNALPRPGQWGLGDDGNLARLNLKEVLAMGSSAHKRLTKGTALSRTSRTHLQRNAQAIADGALTPPEE